MEESIVSFERPWILLIAWLPLLWAVLEWRRTTRRFALALKAISFSIILLALAGPVLNVSDTKTAVAVLVDTSASVSPHDLARASQLATAIRQDRGRNRVVVIPFARTTRLVDASEQGKKWSFHYTAGEAGRVTDLESGIREAIASIPAGMVPRVVLVSDGKENHGSIARAAWQARQLGVPIDTFALEGKPQPNLRLESISLPSHSFTGERFPIDLVVTSPRAAQGVIELTADGKSIGKDPVAIDAGVNRLRVHANLSAAGAFDLAVSVSAPGLGELHFDQAITLRRPRVLFLSEDPRGADEHLIQALDAAHFEVNRSSDALGQKLAGFQLIVLNNWDLESLPASRKAEMEQFVKQGGGLLVIGGDHNIYVERKSTEDALDRALPAKLAPPRSPEGTCVVLIIDKSSSMEGRKMELARLAAIGVIENLRPIDEIGVLIFDNSFQWAVPIRRAEDRSLIKRLVAGITPDGGTQIAPALSEAYHRILAVKAAYKHIVLLTDGISEEGDSLDLSKESTQQHVTISTVGLGQDVNRTYLEKIASYSGGKSYFLSEPSGLAQILLRDVMEHSGSTAVERTLQPIVAHPTEILDGVGMETAPALKGYVKFTAKPTAETILTIDQEKHDPLLTRWQYGLGRSAVFASDAKSRWAADWIGWSGYDRFWTNLFRDLLPHAQEGEARVDYDSANGMLVVDYRLSRDAQEPEKIPPIFAFGPGGFERPIAVKKIAQGAYHGQVYIGSRQGLFRVRPLADSRVFPEVGLYRREQELSDYGSNELLLRQVSAFTGGRFNPRPNQVFDPGNRSVASTMQLWPGLLGIAILLNLTELVLRKWKGILQRWTQ